MKVFKYIVISLSVPFIISFLSCTNSILDDLNDNGNFPPDTQAKFIMADILTSSAFSSTGGDLSMYASIYIEHEVGVHNQTYNAETRNVEPLAASTYNNAWMSAYNNVKNAKLVIKKCSDDGVEKGSAITLGAAKVMLAYNIAIITDLFGDTPFTEAGEINDDYTPKYMQAKIDKQEEIYKKIFALLDEAIVHFDGNDNGPYGGMGAKDFIYQGDASKWKKATYALKARYTMRLLNKSANKNQDLNNILDYISKSFTSASEEFKYSKYDGSSSYNPLYAYNYSREGLGASKSLIDKLTVRNDPRLKQGFLTEPQSKDKSQVTDPSKIVSAENGNPIQEQEHYDVSMACYSVTAPTQLISYHELLFLKAEAMCRLNMTGAKEVLKAAIEANFAHQAVVLQSTIDDWGAKGSVDLSKTVADTYFDTNIAPLFDAAPLQETMIQKYLAFWGASGEAIEAYNDYRRLKAANENFIELKNKANEGAYPKFPMRYAYGSSDVLGNEKVKAAYGDGQYVYTEKVWWAGGTR